MVVNHRKLVWFSIVTLVLSCFTSQIFELLYAKSHFFPYLTTDTQVSANTSTLYRCFATLFTGCQSLCGMPTVQDCCFDCVRGTGPVYLKQVICPVSNLSYRSLRSAGHGDLSRGQMRLSASEVSLSRLQSSGMHFHLNFTHNSTVADNSDPS